MPGPFAPGTHAYDPNWSGLTWNDQDPASPVSADRLSRVSDQLYGLTSRVEEFHVSKFGAYGSAPGVQPLVNESANIQAAIDAAPVGSTVDFGLRWYYTPTSLNWKPGVTFQGVGDAVGAYPYCSALYGNPGTNNLLQFPSGASSGYKMSDMMMLYGGNALSTVGGTTLVSDLRLERVRFGGQYGFSNIYLQGQVEEVYFDRVYLSGADYGFRKVPIGANITFDKCTFKDVTTNGHAINGWRIESNNTNNCTWINPILQTAGQHGFYADVTGLSWTFINANTEGNGQTGKKNRTTLTNSPLAAGSTSCVLAATTGWANGDKITIKGAGVSGRALTVGGSGSTLTGSTFSWAAAAINTATSTQVAAGTPVTNAEWDDFNFTAQTYGAHGGVLFLAGFLGGEGTGGKIRFGANLATNYSQLLNTRSALPVNDYSGNTTYFGIDGRTEIWRPALVGPGLGFSSTPVSQTKAGAPVDGDFINVYDGLQVLDTTNHRIYFRSGGVWKYAALT